MCVTVFAGPVLSPENPKRFSPAEMSPVDPSNPSIIRCFNPATGQMLGTVPVDNPDAVMKVVEDARAAQARWRESSFEERRKVIRIMAQAVHKYRDDICKLAAAETGKTRETWLANCSGLQHVVWPCKSSCCLLGLLLLRSAGLHLWRDPRDPGEGPVGVQRG
jgi:hypothetical protein